MVTEFRVEYGDREDLEGTALLYVENLGEDKKERPFPAYFASTDVRDVCTFFDVRRNSEDAERSKLWAVLGSGAHTLSREDEKAIPFCYYGAPFLMRDRGKLEEIHLDRAADIVFGGRVSFETDSVLSSMIGAYFESYACKLADLFHIMLDEFDLRGYSSGRMQEKLWVFANGLINALGFGDEEETRRIEKEMRMFTSNSPLAGDMSNLIGILKTDDPRKKDVVTYRIERMGALIEGDREEAARLESAIAQLAATEI